LDATIGDIIHGVTRAVELGGIAILLLGMFSSTATFVRAISAATDRETAIRNYRTGLGRAILVGLEFLVAADIINTVAPSLHSVAVLAGIVFIRTFLSFSLGVEIEGRWPWRRVVEVVNAQRRDRADGSGEPEA
jgi:uncharacterized membrane protein